MNVKIILIISLLFVLFSCSDEKELYSCDPNIDSWVKENIEEIQCMTRCEWQELDEELKSATYTAFLPEQKISFWEERFRELEELSLSDKEREHIVSAKQFFNCHKNLFFEENLNDKQFEELDVFFYKWAKYATIELNWDAYIINAMLVSGETIINVNGKLLVKENVHTNSVNMVTSSVEPTCNCNSKSLFPCTPNNESECNKKKDCKRKSCGLFGMIECDGICDEL